ncbi:MAG: CoA pyrophosphatase [Chitinophagales bacterium]|nr:CoA pyrophosphatase [Chitinophagales bacterium]
MELENFSPFIRQLYERLQQALPGEDAQYRMAPSYRPRLNSDAIAALHPKRSGVLMLLYEKNEEWFTVFTQRRSYKGVHSGQMSFPGGKFEEQDGSIVKTALREAEEEVGVRQENVDVLGLLSDLYIPPSNFWVQPVVGYLRQPTVFIPEEREVAEVVEIPISFFANDGSIQLVQVPVGNGLEAKVPAFVFGKHIIWGATAIMLSEFREVYLEIRR